MRRRLGIAYAIVLLASLAQFSVVMLVPQASATVTELDRKFTTSLTDSDINVKYSVAYETYRSYEPKDKLTEPELRDLYEATVTLAQVTRQGQFALSDFARAVSLLQSKSKDRGYPFLVATTDAALRLATHLWENDSQITTYSTTILKTLYQAHEERFVDVGFLQKDGQRYKTYNDIAEVGWSYCNNELIGMLHGALQLSIALDDKTHTQLWLGHLADALMVAADVGCINGFSFADPELAFKLYNELGSSDSTASSDAQRAAKAMADRWLSRYEHERDDHNTRKVQSLSNALEWYKKAGIDTAGLVDIANSIEDKGELEVAVNIANEIAKACLVNEGAEAVGGSGNTQESPRSIKDKDACFRASENRKRIYSIFCGRRLREQLKEARNR